MALRSEIILEYISQHYQEGENIYPGDISKHTNTELKALYIQLHQLSQECKLQEVLEILCPECGQPLGHIYETIGEVPEQITCPCCTHSIKNTLSHAIVIYKRKYDGANRRMNGCPFA